MSGSRPSSSASVKASKTARVSCLYCTKEIAKNNMAVHLQTMHTEQHTSRAIKGKAYFCRHVNCRRWRTFDGRAGHYSTHGWKAWPRSELRRDSRDGQEYIHDGLSQQPHKVCNGLCLTSTEQIIAINEILRAHSDDLPDTQEELDAAMLPYCLCAERRGEDQDGQANNAEAPL